MLQSPHCVSWGLIVAAVRIMSYLKASETGAGGLYAQFAVSQNGSNCRAADYGCDIVLAGTCAPPIGRTGWPHATSVAALTPRGRGRSSLGRPPVGSDQARRQCTLLHERAALRQPSWHSDIMKADECFRFSPLSCGGHSASGHSVPDLPPHRRLPARHPQRGAAVRLGCVRSLTLPVARAGVAAGRRRRENCGQWQRLVAQTCSCG